MSTGTGTHLLVELLSIDAQWPAETQLSLSLRCAGEVTHFPARISEFPCKVVFLDATPASQLIARVRSSVPVPLGYPVHN